MSIVTTIAQQTLALDYSEIKQANPSWPDYMVQDWVFKQQNIETIAGATDINQEQVEQNTEDIATNAANIATNTSDIATNAADIATNASNITTNTANIATNTSDIATNASDIATNASDIATNASDIATNTTNISNHIAETSAHGVTGNNIGTEDYAQTLVGGAVLLAVKISDATQTATSIATADVGAAPATYDQAYAQEQTDLINECKATINDLVIDMTDIVTQFNALLIAEQNAKQMSTT